MMSTNTTRYFLETRTTENDTTTKLSGKLSCPTTNSTVPRQYMFVRHEENPETYQLIWCDEDAYNESDMNIKQTRERLLRIFNDTKLFDNIDECQRFIQQTQSTITYLICAASLAQRLVSQIHEFRNIQSMYIYCPNHVDWATEWIFSYVGDDSDASEPTTQPIDVHIQNCLLCDKSQLQWTANYSKVKTFDDNRGFLMLRLSEDLTKYLMHEKDGIISGLGRQDKTTDNDQTNKWWSHFLEILCQLPYPDNSHLRLVTELKNYYVGKESELRILQEFERDYTPERAIYWYTRDSIIFRLLNRALRQQNIELIFLFGFYMRDISRQLKAEHEKQYKCKELDEPIVRVYRSQIMSMEEVEILDLVFYDTFLINSFLSTSINRNLSLVFLQSALARPEGYASVLFEIELDTRKNSCAFADISHLSQFSEESEVLCMMGIEFRRKEFSYNADEGYYTIKLELFDDISKEVKECRQHTNVRRNLHECCRMFNDDSDDRPLEMINIIFNELCKLFPSENNWLEAHRYRCLGTHQKAIDIWENYKNDSELNFYIDIADIHLKLGQRQIEYSNSEVQRLELAIANYILSLNKPMMDKERAEIYGKLSEIYRLKSLNNEVRDDELVSNETKKIVEYRKLELQETLKFCAPTDEKVLKLYGDMAYMQKFSGYFDEALVNFEKIIQYCMDLKNEIDRYIRLWDYYKSVMEIHRDSKQDYIAALHYQLLAIENIKKLYSIALHHGNVDSWRLRDIQSNKSIIAETYFDLADIYIKIGEFELARQNLVISKQFYEENDNHIRPTNETQLMAIEEKMSIVGVFHKD